MADSMARLAFPNLLKLNYALSKIIVLTAGNGDSSSRVHYYRLC